MGAKAFPDQLARPWASGSEMWSGPGPRDAAGPDGIPGSGRDQLPSGRGSDAAPTSIPRRRIPRTTNQNAPAWTNTSPTEIA